MSNEELKPALRQTDVIGCFSLEREELNPFVKPSNKHGNNGYNTYQSGRKPSRWKEVKFIENVTKDFAINIWSGYANENGWRIVDWNNGEIVAGGRSRF
jgi:hypothetical protein